MKNSARSPVSHTGTAVRKFDELGAKQIYARCPSKEGVGLAVYNRLLRAAGFEVKVI